MLLITERAVSHEIVLLAISYALLGQQMDAVSHLLARAGFCWWLGGGGANIEDGSSFNYSLEQWINELG